MDKVLFLDIDGVIIDQNYADRLHDHGVRRSFKVFNPLKVRFIDEIIEQTGCGVVISSTWRIGRDLRDLRNLFLAAGLGNTKSIIDYTERRSDGDRGKEIMDWLDIHNEDRNKPLHYAVLDDGIVSSIKDSSLFRTKFETGLTQEITDSVIDYLNDDSENG